jgi:hypothetical protein
MRGLGGIFGLFRFGGEWIGRSDRPAPSQELRTGWFQCPLPACLGTRLAPAVQHACKGRRGARHQAKLMRPINPREGITNTEGLVIDNEDRGESPA